MLKASRDTGIACITPLFNRIIRLHKIPSGWDKSMIFNLFNGKGDATDRGNNRCLKLLKHSKELFKQVVVQQIRNVVNIDRIHLGFMPGKGTVETIFIICHVQEKHLAKNTVPHL